MGKWFAALAAVVLATGCKFGAGAFTCAADTDCTGSPGGKCEPGGLCSFSDDSCGPGGQRYGGLSGDKAGQCVDGAQPQPDAGIDTPGAPPPDALVCYGTGIVKVCFASAPTQPLSVSDQTLDTGTPTMCATTVTGGDNYCVVVATTITISGTLRATGPKPLVLIGSDSITTTNGSLIDVGSHRVRNTGVPETGAGADDMTCTAGMLATSRGGGAGGSFTGTGGIGGNGAIANTGTPEGAAPPPIATLRGGCPGGDGNGTTGSAGHGGGAVYLIAGTKISIGGNGINAGGEAGGGGTAGPSGGGGGGGGAGGMIGFDAPMIMVMGSASLVANGGGGGEGGAGGNTNAGANGTDALTTGAAHGGTGGTGSGGDGGNGSAGMAAGTGMGGSSGTNAGGINGGGGGGGGGAGIIKGPAAMLGGNVSPAATP